MVCNTHVYSYIERNYMCARLRFRTPVFQIVGKREPGEGGRFVRVAPVIVSALS
jgi:hypothetical protein